MFNWRVFQHCTFGRKGKLSIHSCGSGLILNGSDPTLEKKNLIRLSRKTVWESSFLKLNQPYCSLLFFPYENCKKNKNYLYLYFILWLKNIYQNFDCKIYYSISVKIWIRMFDQKKTDPDLTPKKAWIRIRWWKY